MGYKRSSSLLEIGGAHALFSPQMFYSVISLLYKNENLRLIVLSKEKIKQYILYRRLYLHKAKRQNTLFWTDRIRFL
ncbi:hypothetical protein HR09_07500 [Porphyromonas gulae]|nr:hypothetical protein HR09_07500 [Porphyromonas gulae]